MLITDIAKIRRKMEQSHSVEVNQQAAVLQPPVPGPAPWASSCPRPSTQLALKPLQPSPGGTSLSAEGNKGPRSVRAPDRARGAGSHALFSFQQRQVGSWEMVARGLILRAAAWEVLGRCLLWHRRAACDEVSG